MGDRTTRKYLPVRLRQRPRRAHGCVAGRHQGRSPRHAFHLPVYHVQQRQHGYLKGEQAACPTCGGDTEIWSRVVGFIRPVGNFHLGKKQEYTDRKKYVIKEEQLGDLTDCECGTLN